MKNPSFFISDAAVGVESESTPTAAISFSPPPVIFSHWLAASVSSFLQRLNRSCAVNRGRNAGRREVSRSAIRRDRLSGIATEEGARRFGKSHGGDRRPLKLNEKQAS